MTVSDDINQAGALCSFFNNLGRMSAKAGKKLATNVLKNPQEELRKLLQKLVLQPQLKDQKQIYQAYLK